ncbi:MAG: LPS export ABC transporter periplasmic protein LptC [Sphingomonas sp.]
MSDLALRVRSERRLWARPGSNHDGVVKTLRTTLPVLIGVLLAFLVVAPVLVGGDVSFVLDKNKVAIARERMRVEHPVYRGEDDKGQPFAIRAGSAVQKSSAEPIVQLRQLAAQIQLKDGPATLAADRGRYDMDRQRVALDTPVQVRTSNGYKLDTSAATVDLKSRKLTSTGAVTGAVPQGTFSADHMTADLESRVVHLDGDTHLRIRPAGRK